MGMVSKLYRGLQQQYGSDTLYVKSKWESELCIELSVDDWHSIVLFIFFFLFLLHQKSRASSWESSNIAGDSVGVRMPIILISWMCERVQGFWDCVHHNLEKKSGIQDHL